MELSHWLGISTGAFATMWFGVAFYANRTRDDLRDLAMLHEAKMLMSKTTSDALKVVFDSLAEASQRHDQEGVDMWCLQYRRTIDFFDKNMSGDSVDDISRNTGIMVGELKAAIEADKKGQGESNGSE